MSLAVSVVVPVRNGAQTLANCLRSLSKQSFTREAFEIIVVDDGSDDESARIAEGCGVRVLPQPPAGVGAARNTGWRAASGRWIAFTDADCLPSRDWLARLLAAVDVSDPKREPMLGAAGRTVGFPSESRASRFVDLSGGLDVERHLSHPRFPFAPSGNVMYRRDALEAVRGFDPRYVSYEACDLHTRLLAIDKGEFVFEPRAVVLHRHRDTWGRYLRQQFSYGRGYAQFAIHRPDALPWSPLAEVRAWGKVAREGLSACQPGSDDEALFRRGSFAKHLAQQAGFLSTYWNPWERAAW